MSENEDIASFLAGLMDSKPEEQEIIEKPAIEPPAPKPVEKRKVKPASQPAPEPVQKRKRQVKTDSTPKKQLLTAEMVYSFICEKEKTGETGWTTLRRVIERHSNKKQLKKDIAIVMAIIEIKRHFESFL